MDDNVIFSVIIPHKDSIDCISRLLNSIPKDDCIEIIIVDNSLLPIKTEDIITDRNYKLFYSEPNRFAGGARNVGIDNAHGKWLIFADADDFFTNRAFDIFSSHIDDENDLIYFETDSVYDDTLCPSDRNLMYNKLIDDYLSGKISENAIKLQYLVPWGKMINRDFVIREKIVFDEVLAANDVMFSTHAGYLAKKFSVDSQKVYVVTTRRGSLANRQDLLVTKSRYMVALRRNKFLRSVGLRNMQSSVMLYLYRALKFGLRVFLLFLIDAIKYHQNVFIGWRNWAKTYKSLSLSDNRNKEYITK